ncbi:hypothetical protein CspHIS471_0607150 [Cutaneotrichosporon sp. HIS471]|nr:hypothetical protein CspHIS471_0607150 [Cutaneotrichosporon sp. HIS471]
MAALTSSGVERVLRNENTTQDEAYEIIKAYYVANSRNQRSIQMMASKLGHFEADFPRFSEQFDKVRERYKIEKIVPNAAAEWPPQDITTAARLSAALGDQRCSDDNAVHFISQFAEHASMSDTHSQDYLVRKLDELEQQYPRFSGAIRSVRSRHTAARTGAVLNAAGHRPSGPTGFTRPHDHSGPPSYGHQGPQHATAQQAEWHGAAQQQYAQPGQYAPPPGGPGYQPPQYSQQQQYGQQQQYSQQQQYGQQGQQQYGQQHGANQGYYQAPQQQQQTAYVHPTSIGTKIVPPPPIHVQAQQMHNTAPETTGQWRPPNLTSQIFGYVKPSWNGK